MGPDHLNTLTARRNLANRRGEAGNPAGATAVKNHCRTWCECCWAPTTPTHPGHPQRPRCIKVTQSRFDLHGRASLLRDSHVPPSSLAASALQGPSRLAHIAPNSRADCLRGIWTRGGKWETAFAAWWLGAKHAVGSVKAGSAAAGHRRGAREEARAGACPAPHGRVWLIGRPVYGGRGTLRASRASSRRWASRARAAARTGGDRATALPADGKVPSRSGRRACMDPSGSARGWRWRCP